MDCSTCIRYRVRGKRYGRGTLRWEAHGFASRCSPGRSVVYPNVPRTWYHVPGTATVILPSVSVSRREAVAHAADRAQHDRPARAQLAAHVTDVHLDHVAALGDR